MVGVWRHCSRSTVRGAGYPPPTVLEVEDAAAVRPGDGVRVLCSADVLFIVRRINASSTSFSPRRSSPHFLLSSQTLSHASPSSRHLTISLVISFVLLFRPHPPLLNRPSTPHGPCSYIQTHARVCVSSVYSVGAVSSSYSLSALVLMLDGNPSPHVRGRA